MARSVGLAQTRVALRMLLRLTDRGEWVAPGVLGCAYPRTERALAALSASGVRLLVNLHGRPHDPARLVHLLGAFAVAWFGGAERAAGGEQVPYGGPSGSTWQRVFRAWLRAFYPAQQHKRSRNGAGGSAWEVSLSFRS